MTTMPINRETFLAFLVEAKTRTYAAQGGAATKVSPMLPGSKQLEYAKDALLYRDVYFGNDYFVGQETVYYDATPVWSMSYAGGKLKTAEIPIQIQEVYAFLQEALRHIAPEQPYRGPSVYKQGDLAYTNESHGDPDRFWGRETITYQNVAVYQLHYSGGMLQ